MARPTGPERAVCYVRISKDVGDDKYSLETQLEGCLAHAAARGWVVVDTFREGHTARVLHERSELGRLREIVREGGAEVVLAFCLDRIIRSQTHCAILVEEFEQHGARLELVTESFEDTVIGRYVRNTIAMVAEMEREKIAERTLRGRLARVRSGKLPPAARPTYGYRWTDATKAAMEPDPLTSPVVQRVYRELLDGATLRAVANRLTAEGVPVAHTGRRWWTRTLVQMVRHPYYGGPPAAWRTSKVRARGKKRDVPRPPEEWIGLSRDVVPALVGADEWALAQRRLGQNRAAATRNAKAPERYLLRGGLARCAGCGAALHGAAVVQRKAGRPYEYRYYVCGDRQNRGGGPTVCPHPARTTVDELDRLAWGALQRGPLPARTRPPGPTRAAARREELERALRHLKRQQDNIVAALAGAETDEEREPLERRNKALANQRRELAAQLDALGESGADRLEAALAGLRALLTGGRARLMALGRQRFDPAVPEQPDTYAEMRRWLLRSGLTVRVARRGRPGPRVSYEWRG